MSLVFTNTMQEYLAENIVVDNEIVGTLISCRTSQNSSKRSFHACIELNLFTKIYYLQGFGATKIEAIVEAMRSGRHEARNMLAAISAFEDKLIR